MVPRRAHYVCQGDFEPALLAANSNLRIHSPDRGIALPVRPTPLSSQSTLMRRSYAPLEKDGYLAVALQEVDKLMAAGVEKYEAFERVCLST